MNAPAIVGLVCGLLAASVGVGFVHPWGDLRSVPAGGPLASGNAPAEVVQILENKCADCHSNRTQWPAYSRLAPVSWIVERDVYRGRAAMNLSRWDAMRSDERTSVLTRIVAELRSGEMPPKRFTLVHPSMRLSEGERKALTAWAMTERRRIRTLAAGEKVVEGR